MKAYRCLPRWWLPIILLAALASATRGRAGDDYTLSQTKTFSLLNRYVLKNVSGSPVTQVKARVYVGANSEAKATDPPAPNDSRYQRKIRFRLNPRPTTLTTDALGNVFGEFTFARIAPGSSVTITVEKIVQNSGIAYAGDALQRDGSYDEFLAIKGNDQYLKPGEHIESGNETIKQAIAPYAALTDKPRGERVRLMFEALNTFLTYDESPQYAHKGALNALVTRRGVCTEFAGLFVAFCRAMGIPARVVNGYWDRRDREFPLNTAVDVSDDRHAWPEFYLPGVGWVPAEPTAITTMNGQRIYNLRYFATIPATDRHFIWGYGLEAETQTGISYSYMAVTDDAEVLQASLAEESITRLPDDAPPAP